ncbi:hypothetical protein ABK040_005556 [Willaertia magna]
MFENQKDNSLIDKELLLKNQTALLTKVNDAIDFYKLRKKRIIDECTKLVIVGNKNVGKSSLMYVLCGYGNNIEGNECSKCVDNTCNVNVFNFKSKDYSLSVWNTNGHEGKKEY